MQTRTEGMRMRSSGGRGRKLTMTVLLALGAGGLAGCSGLSLAPRPMAFYDLGLAEPQPLPSAAVPAQVEVKAPSWLDSSAMQYRLAWNDPDRRRAYGESRWAAPPAQLLAASLRRALSAEGAGGGNCRLRVELDEFVQHFDSEVSSSAQIVVRAELLARQGEVPLATRGFAIGEAAASADARGGVAAFRYATRQLVADLAGWLSELDRDPARRLNTVGRCL
jgi:cholesterol transport system auxiliary component